MGTSPLTWVAAHHDLVFPPSLEIRIEDPSARRPFQRLGTAKQPQDSLGNIH
jgi:hypothetical protein